MKNFVNWFEIPAGDFGRAVTFYKAVLGIEIRETELLGTKMGFFPSDGMNVSGAIVQGEDYKPSMEGVTLYLNGGENLQPMLDKAAGQKGQIIVPKTLINPEMGYFAMFIDTEGNKIALHSMH